MAVVGHWNTLADAENLTQSMLLQGVVKTVIEEGHLLPRLPVKQVSGKDLLFNREDSWTASDGADFFAIREQISWSEDVTYTPVTIALKRVIRQDPIDLFVQDTYNSVNEYKAVMMEQLAKRMTRFIEDRFVYSDLTFDGSKAFDGLHAFAQAGGVIDSELDIDEGGALALFNIRILIAAMKLGDGQLGKSGTILLMSHTIANRIDAGYAEAGLVRSSVTHSMLQNSGPMGEAGTRITMFDGVPIVRSDFMVAEEAGTGEGSDAKGKFISGTKEYTIFAIRFGQTEDGGLSLLFGGPGMSTGNPFKHKSFDALEDYDSGGERLVSYMALADGSYRSVGRIHGITDAEVTP